MTQVSTGTTSGGNTVHIHTPAETPTTINLIFFNRSFLVAFVESDGALVFLRTRLRYPEEPIIHASVGVGDDVVGAPRIKAEVPWTA